MEIMKDCFYTKEHEWINIDGNKATIGISDYAQSSLGDITFIELPAVDQEVDQFEQIASVESVKAASDIFSPMSGKIVEVNKDLEKNPELINQSPFENGWIAKVQIGEPSEKSNLMDAEEYENFVKGLED